MKRVFLLIVGIVLGMVTVCAQAETPFDSDFFTTYHLWDNGIISTQSVGVSQNVVYDLLSNGEVYAWDAATNQYSLYAQVPAVPKERTDVAYTQQSSSMKEALAQAVFGLIGSPEGLYGFNPITGAIGVLDSQGIQWGETRLDTAVLMKSDRTWPQSFLNPFTYNRHLYAYYDMTEGQEKEGIQTALLDFDLSTGACETTLLPDTLTFCQYKQGTLLALVDNGTEVPALAQYDIASKQSKMLAVEVPAAIKREAFADTWSILSEIGGLAYDSHQDSIYLATIDGLWRSTAGMPFAAMPLETMWEDLNPAGQAFLLSGGKYVFHNGFVYAK